MKFTWLILVVVALGALSLTAQDANQRQNAREQLFQETMRLLDKIENEYPRAQVDVVKVRERVHKLYQNPVVENHYADEPEINFARRRSNRSEDWRKFYNSISGQRNAELCRSLVARIRNQKALKYPDARRFVMLEVDDYDNKIECIYTGKTVSASRMPDHNVMNIEHSWPQSKGAKGIAKSDLHHLFPTDPIANSTRSSLPFGMVRSPSWAEGGSECDGDVFEPRKKYRGNIARALFYFSVRYNKRISSSEESVLRRWNKEDPVDANERSRNDRVERIQGNRNPFIDHPELADRINDF